MGRSADREQRHHRAIVGQAVEGAGADHRHAVHERGIDAPLRGEAHIGVAERIERDRHPARGRAGERGEHVGRDRKRDERTAPDRQHPVAHHRERGQHGDDRAEAHETGNAEGRQDGSVGAGVHALAQGGQPATIDDDERQDRGRQRHRHRPYARHRRQRGGAPALLGQKRKVESRQNEQRHQEIDAHDHRERQHGHGDRRRGVAVAAVADFRGIEFAGGRRPLANDLIFGDRIGSRHRRRHSPRRPAAQRLRHGRATTSRIPA